MIIGICGAGTMGRGIAIASLMACHEAIMLDLSTDACSAAVEAITKQLGSAVTRGKLTEAEYEDCMTRLRTTTEIDDLSGCDIVIEAIAERLDIKHAFFRSVETVCRPDAILASNTSSISIASLARCLNDPSRFIGLHFFNPAHIMKLVEVIRGPRTSEHVVSACVTFARHLGKVPVVAKDAPGFIVNRIARNYYNEAQRVVTEGAATIEQTDILMKGLGFKMGPFELMDLIGVDVNLDVTKSQWEQFFYEPRFTPSVMQQQYVDAGMHGNKSGGGFTRPKNTE